MLNQNIHSIHLNPITTNYFLSIPYILSLVDLLTFLKSGVNRILMDLIGVRFPINCRRCAIFVMKWNIWGKVGLNLEKRCNFVINYEYYAEKDISGHRHTY